MEIIKNNAIKSKSEGNRDGEYNKCMSLILKIIKK